MFVFETKLEELAAMANIHTTEGCATGLFESGAVKNAEALTITKRLTVAKEDVPDKEAVPYFLANTVKSYQRAIVNPTIDVKRFTTLAKAADITVLSTMRSISIIAEIREQLYELHRLYGRFPFMVFINSRVYSRILKSDQASLMKKGWFSQGNITIACKGIDGDYVLPVKDALMKSSYTETTDGICPAPDVQTYNWIICPFGMVTGEAKTALRFIESPVPDAWMFEYTKFVPLWKDKSQMPSIAVNILKRERKAQ